MRSLRVIYLTVLSLTLLLSAQALLPAEENPIRIGATLSLNGNYSEPSRMIYDAYRLWEKEINQTGGLLGRKVRLEIIDDESKPGKVREGYRFLIEELGADLLLSPYSTPLTIAAAEITEPEGHVIIACGASGSTIWERGYKNVYGMYALADRYCIGYLDLLARQGFETIVILHENNDFNTEVAKGAVEWAGRFGLRVRDVIAFDPDSVELITLMRRIIEIDADGVIVSSYPEKGYEFLQSLDDSGYRPEALAMTIIPIHPDFYTRAGTIAEGVFGFSQWEPMERIPFPGTIDFIRNFRNFSGRSPSYHAGSAYAACQLLERAVRYTGSLDQERISDYISSLDTVTVIGRFKVDHTGKQIGHNPILIQWQDGEKEIVYPPNMRTARPRF